MDANEPALFDIPPQELPVPSERQRRGRNRETWVRTVSAEVTIVDTEAVCEAAQRAKEVTVAIGLRDDPYGEDMVAEDPELTEAADAFDALAWLLWPTDGLEGPLEAGAFRVLSVGVEVEPESDDRGTLRWAVTVKLTDTRILRRLAAHAYPEQAGLIADSLAAAWQFSADPFAPLHTIPGIAWRPGPVAVQHVPKKERQEPPMPLDVSPRLNDADVTDRVDRAAALCLPDREIE